MGGALVALAAAALRDVALYSSPFPRWDDLGWIEALSPLHGIDLAWLWSAHNEHRLLVPRLVGVPIGRLAGDLRAVLVFDVLLLAAMAFALCAAVRAARTPRRTELADVVFPLLLLTPAAARTLLTLQGITYVVPLALLCVPLASAARAPRADAPSGPAAIDAPGPRAALAIGIAAVLLPLCGGPGLTTAPVLVLWMCALAWALRRATGAAERATRTVLLACSAATVAAIAAYFVGFERPAHAQWNPSALGVLQEAWKFLANGLGQVAEATWPWSGAATLAFAGAVAWTLARGWRRRERRAGLSGLGAVWCAGFGMALGVGQFRAAPGLELGFESRYVPLAALWWCAGIAVLACHAPRALSRRVALALAAALVLALPVHRAHMRAEGEHRREVTDAFAVDVAHGLSVDELVRRFPSCFLSDPEVFRIKLQAIHDFGLWPYLTEYAARRARGFAGTRVSPARIESAADVAYRWVDGRFVLAGPADHALRCRDLAGARLSGSFGLHPASRARLGGGSVRFTIEALAPGGATTLLHEHTLRGDARELEPRLHDFAVRVSSDADEVVLRVARTGADAATPLWTLWAGLRRDAAADAPLSPSRP